MLRLSEAPTWALEAGVAYANDEWGGAQWVTVQDRDERIIVEWEHIEGFDPTATDKHGTLESGGANVERKEVKATPEAFKEELAERD
ncbi:hypothetical protein PNQ29_11710 [Halobacterium salinarum]|uniref:hypothetical protein n=1 Tax=Halobacterium salinarum TaxID=2242 RepID=UPI002556379E|nr:hypothetical protein [Halobacterium salinarum]MDL0120385.1 hypothetical protein [Halobacterium salinarum]